MGSVTFVDSERSAAAVIGLPEQAILLSRRRHGGIMPLAVTRTYLFIARSSFLARCTLTGARRCSSAKRRAAFTSLADSDPGQLEARASRVRPSLHNKLLRRETQPE